MRSPSLPRASRRRATVKIDAWCTTVVSATSGEGRILGAIKQQSGDEIHGGLQVFETARSHPRLCNERLVEVEADRAPDRVIL